MERICRTCDHGAIHENMVGSMYEEVQCLYPLSHREKENATGSWQKLNDSCVFWKLKEEFYEDDGLPV